jgi:hypothetical protein
MLFRWFALRAFKLRLAVVLDFRDEMEKQFQINLRLLRYMCETGNVLTDGM